MKKYSHNAYKAIDYFCDLSITYGVYASHYREFTKKGYPIREFDVKTLKGITEEPFPQEITLSEQNYFKIYSPARFSGTYELITSSKNPKLGVESTLPKYHAFLVEIESAEFDYNTVIDGIKNTLINAVNEHYRQEGASLSESEIAAYNVQTQHISVTGIFPLKLPPEIPPGHS